MAAVLEVNWPFTQLLRNSCWTMQLGGASHRLWPQWWSDVWVVTLRVRTRERIVICLFYMPVFPDCRWNSVFLGSLGSISVIFLWLVIHTYYLRHIPAFTTSSLIIPSFAASQASKKVNWGLRYYPHPGHIQPILSPGRQCEARGWDQRTGRGASEGARPGNGQWPPGEARKGQCMGMSPVSW